MKRQPPARRSSRATKGGPRQSRRGGGTLHLELTEGSLARLVPPRFDLRRMTQAEIRRMFGGEA